MKRGDLDICKRGQQRKKEHFSEDSVRCWRKEAGLIQGFLRGLVERTKGSQSCVLVQEWTWQGLFDAGASVSQESRLEFLGTRLFPCVVVSNPKAAVSEVSQYPMFSLPTWSASADVGHSLSCKQCYMMLYSLINFCGLSHQLRQDLPAPAIASVLFISHLQPSHPIPCQSRLFSLLVWSHWDDRFTREETQEGYKSIRSQG